MTKHGDLVNECLEWLAIEGIFAWPNNTGALKTDNRFIKYGKIGSADILGIQSWGQHLEVECKIPPDYQKKPQEIHQRMVEKNNGIYLLVHTVDELAMRLKR